eukprot:2623633-Amphidinium_carterae.2
MQHPQHAVVGTCAQVNIVLIGRMDLLTGRQHDNDQCCTVDGITSVDGKFTFLEFHGPRHHQVQDGFFESHLYSRRYLQRQPPDFGGLIGNLGHKG